MGAVARVSRPLRCYGLGSPTAGARAVAPANLDVHVCLPGLLSTALGAFLDMNRAALAARGIGRERVIVVDEALWDPVALAAFAHAPRGAVTRAVLWRPTAVECVAHLARMADPTAHAAGFAEAAAGRFAALEAVAAFDRVERRSLADAGFRVFDAVLDACALPAGPWRWPPSIDGLLAADGAVDLDGLAAVITDRWRGAR